MSRDLFSNELTAVQHLEGAKAHLAFADALAAAGATTTEDPVAVGWAITALFYSAVHCVRAYLVSAKKAKVVSHEDFRRLEREFPELNASRAPYQTLKQQSESARYYLNKNFTWADYQKLRRDAARVLNTWEPRVRRVG